MAHTSIPAGEPAERPVHPAYGRALSGRPYVVDGVVFRPYSAGILRYVRVSDDGRLEIRDNRGSTMRASCDDRSVGERFRSFEAAARAAIKARG